MKRDIIEVTDLKEAEIRFLLSRAFAIKKNPKKYSKSLSGKILAMIFHKPSTRTRVSFEAGMLQLGGEAINLTSSELQLSRGEAIKDTAKTLSGYVDAIMIRTTKDEDIFELAKWADIPVINGLSKSFHPCQALSDIFTVCEAKGLDEAGVLDFDFSTLKIVFVGDANNVSRSLLNLSTILNFKFGIAGPEEFKFSDEEISRAQEKNKNVYCSKDVNDCFFKDADFVYTDVWTSMGDEAQEEKRKRMFEKYQINEKLLSKFEKNVFVMHCLPARRGQEITDEVIDGKNSIIFEQAHNRMHFQKALLHWLLTDGK